ncbi:hypothetical protein RAS1_26070 [Phycisphaerae bacterium RAS1]|nr:hypothetical protein RAS1_26070 [Phycisphaerae bacterium RAS1]
MNYKTKVRKLLAYAVSGGVLLQTATCDTNQVAQIVGSLGPREVGNIIASSVFFALDNLLVRFTT